MKKEIAVGGVPVRHDKLSLEQIRETYKNHEVAAHTLYYCNFTMLTEKEIIEAVEEDRKALEKPWGTLFEKWRTRAVVRITTIGLRRFKKSTRKFRTQERLHPPIQRYYEHWREPFEIPQALYKKIGN